MEIRHLRAFIAVADTHSIRRASQQLHIVQSALSRTIQDLERELGVELFVRNPHGMHLTRAGERFMEGARRTVAEATAAMARARDARESADGPLIVGIANPELCGLRFKVVLRRYKKACPAVAVHLESMASVAISEAIATRGIDIGVGYALTPTASGITVETVREDRMAAVVVARGHRLARHHQLSIFHLQRYKFLLYHRAVNPRMFDRILAAFQQVGFTPELVPAVDQLEDNAATVFALVSGGYGWTLWPTFARAAVPATLKYVPLTDIAIPFEVQMVLRSDDRSTRTRHFRRIVQETVPARTPFGGRASAHRVLSVHGILP